MDMSDVALLHAKLLHRFFIDVEWCSAIATVM